MLSIDLLVITFGDKGRGGGRIGLKLIGQVGGTILDLHEQEG